MKLKSIIVLLLIIIISFAACSPKAQDKAFDFDAYKSAYSTINLSKYVRTTEIYSNDILLSRETKEHVKTGNIIHEFLMLEKVSIYSADMEISEEEYYIIDNVLWQKSEGEWQSNSGDIGKEPSLRLNKEYFESIEITKRDNGSELTALVKEDMKTLFLQESPTFAYDITIKLTEVEGKITSFVVNYHTNNHYIIIAVNYLYTPFNITLPASIQQ